MTVTADLPSSPYAPATVAGILDAAADELVLHGWQRGGFGTCNGPKCIEGAIAFVVTGQPAGGSDVCDMAYKALRQIVRESAFTWNDKQRDRRKVVRALRRAARKVRSGEITV